AEADELRNVPLSCEIGCLPRAVECLQLCTLAGTVPGRIVQVHLLVPGLPLHERSPRTAGLRLPDRPTPDAALRVRVRHRHPAGDGDWSRILYRSPQWHLRAPTVSHRQELQPFS